MVRFLYVLFILCCSYFVKAQDIQIFKSFSELEFLFEEESDSVHVINFWATWCGPCVAELPYFVEASETFSEQAVRFSFVSLDFKKQFETKLIPFLESNDIPGTHYNLWDLNYNAWIDKVNPEWSGAIPITMILGPKGKEFVLTSFESEKELLDLIARALK
jgi:thiol-disulfide isomerase/thioredoxin